MASGSWYVRIIPPLFVIIYIATYIAIWLIMVQTILRYCSLTIIQITVWTLGLCLFFIVIDQLLLWPFGRCEGYPFLNPFIPLAIYPSFLIIMHTISYPLLLVWFCITSSCITLFFLDQTSLRFLAMVLAIIPWLYGFTITPPVLPIWLKTIGHLPLVLPSSIDVDIGSMLICHELDRIHTDNPIITTIVMPESAWNGSMLTSITDLATLKHPIKHILVGSFTQQNEGYYNSCYYFQNGLLHYRYDKRHAVPVTERIAPWFSKLNTALFFEKSPPIKPCHHQRLPIQLPSIGLCVIYICSELFCNNWPDDICNVPIFALVNDWWFRMPHFRQLMALTARLYAMKWKRSILYISFHYAQYFDTYGQTAKLATPAAYCL
jgi:hypothetical protein